MKRPKIDPVFQALMRPLSDAEYRTLSVKLQTEGFTDSLIVWKETGILLDGHHRLRICDEESIKYFTQEMSFPSRDLALEWVVNHQLGRRNLTEEQVKYFRGKEYLRVKENGSHEKRCQDGNVVLPQRTSEAVAEEHGVSPRTVMRDSKFAEAVDEIASSDPEKAKEILHGKSGMTPGQVIESVKAPTPETLRPKSGAELFNWREFDAAVGVLVRSVDRLGGAYGVKDEKDAEELRRTMSRWRDAFRVWARRISQDDLPE